MNIKIISAAVMIRTSLPMYSGKPVIGTGGYRPCHGHFSIIEILPQFDRKFNQILFSWNMWKVFQYQSQNNLTEQKERLKSTDFTHFPVQMSAIRTLPEFSISYSHMLIFPAFRAVLFRKISLFSHRFQNF